MHNAPAVSYPVGRALFAGLAAGGVWFAGAAVTLAWTWSADAADWRQAGASVAVAVTGAAALASWLRSPTGYLRWDGPGWTAPHTSQAGALEVVVDLQQVLLVRWCGPGFSRWLWLERRRCPDRWLDLRRAVYSRATLQALPPARPPAATP